MRVLIILKYIPTPDNQQKSDLLRSAIAAHTVQGYGVVLLTSGKSAEHEWEEIEVKRGFAERLWTYLIYKYFPGLIGTFLCSAVAKRVARYHRQKPIDIVFADCTSNRPAIQGYEIKKALGIPLVIREHKRYERKVFSLKDLPPTYLHVLRAADSVYAVSPMLAEIMKSLGIREDVNCLPNALSDEFFLPPTEPGNIRKWAGQEFVFAGWTRWRDFKRVDILLKAFRQLVDNGYKARLVVAGPIEPATNEQWAHDFVSEVGLNEKVLFLGQIPRNEIHQLAHSCDCCVLTSDFETFGLPALEGLAAGKPVVTTISKGPEYLVDSDQLGRVVERGSVEAVFKGMKDVYDNYSAFDSEIIRNMTYNRFSRTAVARQYTVIYEEVLEKSTGLV